MSLVYATVADLTAVLGEATPDDATATRMLRTASGLVRRATRAALYNTTATGLPSDPDVAEAFRDATTAQVQAWVTLGVDPLGGPAAVTGTPQSSSIGPASVNYGTRPGADQDRVDTLTALVPDAADYLDATGLPVAVWTY